MVAALGRMGVEMLATIVHDDQILVANLQRLPPSVAEIARSHHGTMEVSATAGATTFSFSMPAILHDALPI
jgi:hypothetical protein